MVETMERYVRLRRFFFFSSRRRHTRFDCDWSSDVCSSDLGEVRDRAAEGLPLAQVRGDGDPVAPPGVGAGEGRPAEARVEGRPGYQQVVQIGRASCRERV